MEPPTTNPDAQVPPPPDQPARLQTTPGSWKLMGLIIAALVAWGIFLAVGVFLNLGGEAADRFDIRRPLLVLGCTMTFLTFWLVLLWSKSRRTA
ncbi:hypothetical protein M4951_06775 [Blastopirellula sp. J2-11]|uniref:hypothetical protein n=1 Tax=Blastopirellula sp. J2-11 TaxID=2943192 RepID=UPI0021C6A8B2|nr:hypothetical protein [Blastopirellula sp. J2-11]UUO08014.1 hypothetical protein M4951_06775 [Blastopirellula sp. J2-11]